MMNTSYLEQFCDSPDIDMIRKCVWAVTEFDQIVCGKKKLRKSEENESKVYYKNSALNDS